MRPERDACGIGFVTDREGRASRDIVETALTALACMTHRGAVAADALTADGHYSVRLKRLIDLHYQR